MTTAVESVSSAVRRYVAAVSGGAGAVPEVFDALANYVVGGLQPDETVLRVACLRNLRPDGTTTAALAVLTDRALLLAEEGVPGQRLPVADLDVMGMDTDHGPALDLVHAGTLQRIVAAPVDGWDPALVRAELQELVAAMTDAPDAVQAALPPAQPEPAASPLPAAPPAAEPVPSGAHAASDAEYGKARFVGDAAPVGGIPLSRLFNAICYIIAGIALVVMSQLAGFPGGGSMALAIVIGLAAIAYGAKIMLTRTSYWVSSWVYLLAFGSVAAMFGFLAK
jgi:hypothetical protein